MAVSAHADRHGQLADGLRIVVTDEGAATTIAPDGEWDLGQRDAARHVIRRALVRRPERVVLDLTRLTFMDSTGVHGVIELAGAAERLSISLVVIPGPRAVQQSFELCGLSNAVTFVPAAGYRKSRETPRRAPRVLVSRVLRRLAPGPACGVRLLPGWSGRDISSWRLCWPRRNFRSARWR